MEGEVLSGGLFLQSPLNKRLTHSLLSTPKMIRRLCSPTDPDTEIPKARGARRKRKTKRDLKGAAEERLEREGGTR